MTDSEVVNKWMEETKLENTPNLLICLLEERFPNAVPSDVIMTIRQNPSAPILNDWFRKAATIPSIDDFVRILQK